MTLSLIGNNGRLSVRFAQQISRRTSSPVDSETAAGEGQKAPGKVLADMILPDAGEHRLQHEFDLGLADGGPQALKVTAMRWD